jgi:hypothetical protein
MMVKRSQPRSLGGMLAMLVLMLMLTAAVIYGLFFMEAGYGTRATASMRELPVRSHPAAHLQLHLTDLERGPNVRIQGTALPDGGVLYVWLWDATGEQAPRILQRIDVGAAGAVDTELRIPDNVLFFFTHVIGEQDERPIFSAPLG